MCLRVYVHTTHNKSKLSPHSWYFKTVEHRFAALKYLQIGVWARKEKLMYTEFKKRVNCIHVEKFVGRKHDLFLLPLYLFNLRIMLDHCSNEFRVQVCQREVLLWALECIHVYVCVHFACSGAHATSASLLCGH
jgi:hypothetical protein